MPVANITDARDTVYAMLKTAWGGISSPGKLFWDDVADNPPNGDYGEVSLRHGPSGQSSLTGDDGTRYGSQADLIVDIFTPAGAGAKAPDKYTIAVQNAFRGPKSIPDKIWFIYVQVSEQGRKGAHRQTRCTVRFKYDEVF